MEGLAVLMSKGMMEEIVVWSMMICRGHHMQHSNHFFMYNGGCSFDGDRGIEEVVEGVHEEDVA